MDEEEIHWQCPHCGAVNWHDVCHRGCGRPRPDLTGWSYDTADYFWFHPEHPPASVELRDWRRAHPGQPAPPGMT
jgi:hypothetical protein